jgi:hypothetical protein
VLTEMKIVVVSRQICSRFNQLDPLLLFDVSFSHFQSSKLLPLALHALAQYQAGLMMAGY